MTADNPGPMTLDGTRSYRVGNREAVLLDPGPGGEGSRERWRALAGDAGIRWVLLSHAHPDHAEGARAAAELLGADLAASPGTLERLSLDGRVLEDGAEVEVDGGESAVRVLETPGHSPDHLCLFRAPDRVLFTGDLILGEGSSLVGHPEGSVSDCLASLGRLLELEPQLLLPGHGPDVSRAEERLRAYRDHRLGRTGQVRGAVSGGARSVEAIREEVYGELPTGLEWAADATVRAHLIHLEERGEDLPEIAGRDRAPRLG